MSKQKTTGLKKRGSIWHFAKIVVLPDGRRVEIRGSSGTSDRAVAEAMLLKRVSEVQQAYVYGEAPRMTFEQAATRYLQSTTIKSADRAAYALQRLVPHLGHVELGKLHDGTPELVRYKERRVQQVAAGTVNKELGVLRRILSLAARSWRTASGVPYLQTPPTIAAVDGDERKAHLLSRREEVQLLAQLPEHLRDAAIFALNTGLRASEQAGLKWEWEQYVPALNTTVFVLPEGTTKSGRSRIVPLNDAARAVVEKQRGKHAEYVFTYEGEPVTRFNNHAFRRARTRAGLVDLTWHSLRHTYATRLRAAQVPVMDIAALMGHSVPGLEMTERYSAPAIGALIEQAARLDDEKVDIVLSPLRGTVKGQSSDNVAVLH